jgi:ubiquinone/menaquinone biosynthesis C-methylase UbiE
MKPGDFSSLAENYAKYRPGYSELVLNNLSRYIQFTPNHTTVADVGAGTGIWSKLMHSHGFKVTAIEPNDEMRDQGIGYCSDTDIKWSKGSAENTSLTSCSVDWVTMASSFHWANLEKALAEFHRIIKPGGYLTILWNPRNIDASTFHQEIEQLIVDFIPNLKRVSSGLDKHVRNYHDELASTGHFGNIIFVEHCYDVIMSKEKYIGAWKSVNDIQAQAGEKTFSQIIKAIENKISSHEEIVVPYKTRSWTCERND